MAYHLFILGIYAGKIFIFLATSTSPDNEGISNKNKA